MLAGRFGRILRLPQRPQDAPKHPRRGHPEGDADKNIGEWNTFELTIRGDRVTVRLNGQTVVENAELPGVPAEGPIGLQHHGGFRDGRYTAPPNLVQFRNIEIKEL